MSILKIENLTKENFWNALMEKYPKAMNHFCQWVDDYKEANDWDALFGNHFTERKIKYHHLPFALQLGIWLQYLMSQSKRGGGPAELGEEREEWVNEITQAMGDFETYENSIN